MSRADGIHPGSTRIAELIEFAFLMWLHVGFEHPYAMTLTFRGLDRLLTRAAPLQSHDRDGVDAPVFMALCSEIFESELDDTSVRGGDDPAEAGG